MGKHPLLLGQKNIVQTENFPKRIYKCNTIPLRISAEFFVETDKFEIYMGLQGTHNIQKNLEKEQSRRAALSNSRTYIMRW
jgi:hypothetical protein